MLPGQGCRYGPGLTDVGCRCLALGSVLRQVQWDDVKACAGEEVAGSLEQYWVHIAGTVSKIMPAHAADAAVQAYGTYLLAGKTEHVHVACMRMLWVRLTAALQDWPFASQLSKR